MDLTSIGPVVTALFGFFIVHLLNLWRESAARKAQWKRDDEVARRNEDKNAARSALQCCVELLHQLTPGGAESPDSASLHLTELLAKAQAEALLLRDAEVSDALIKGTQAYGVSCFASSQGDSKRCPSGPNVRKLSGKCATFWSRS